jgi:hypothetical protein
MPEGRAATSVSSAHAPTTSPSQALGVSAVVVRVVVRLGAVRCGGYWECGNECACVQCAIESIGVSVCLSVMVSWLGRLSSNV